MIKILLFCVCLLCIKLLPVKAHEFNFRRHQQGQQSEPDRLMNLFIKAVESNDENEVKQFITENYSSGFLGIPISVHQKIINSLHKDFVHCTVAQATKTGANITFIIKNPVNKTKQVTIETDGNTPAKISLIDVKD